MTGAFVVGCTEDLIYRASTEDKRVGRRETVWEERFRSVLVEGAGEALATMAAYIDLSELPNARRNLWRRRLCEWSLCISAGTIWQKSEKRGQETQRT